MRITIDTGELRSLATVYRQVAGDVRGHASSVQRAVDETSLNMGDRRLARAGVPARVHDVARSVDRVAGQLEGQASAIERRAQLLDLDQGGGIPVGIGWLLPALPIAWGGDGRGGHWIGMPILRPLQPNPRAWFAAAVATGAAVLAPAVKGSHAVMNVGRAGVSRLGAHMRAMAASMARFGRGVVHVTAAAWRRGLAAGRGAYRRVVDGLRGLVSKAAGVFTSALQVLRTTGRFVADPASFTWSLLKSLPGKAIGAFKKLWHALVDLPVWKEIRRFVDWTLGAATWVQHKGGEAYRYLFGPLKPFTPPDAPHADLGPGVHPVKVETVDFGADLTVIFGVNPGVGISKTYYSDGTVDVTLEEDLGVEFELGVGGGAKAGAASKHAGAGATAGIKGKHKVTWRFNGPNGAEKAEAFLAAVKQRYIRELGRWLGLMIVPFGHFLAMGSGLPSLIGDGEQVWGSPLRESWTGAVEGKATAEASRGAAKGKAEYSNSKGITYSENKVTGERELAFEFSQSVKAGIYGTMSGAVGASLSMSAGVTMDRSGHPQSLAFEAEGMLTAELASKAFGMRGKSGQVAKFKVSGSLPLSAHLQELAERAVRERSPAAFQALMDAAGKDLKLKVAWGTVTSDEYEVGANGKIGVKVGAKVSYDKATYVQQGQKEMTVDQLVHALAA